MTRPSHTSAHRRARAEFERWVTSATPCVYCHEPLGDDVVRFHLAHNDDGHGYLGPSHPHCNSKRWSESPNAKGHVSTDRLSRFSNLGRMRKFRRVFNEGDGTSAAVGVVAPTGPVSFFQFLNFLFLTAGRPCLSSSGGV